jgi:hypothetical protein
MSEKENTKGTYSSMLTLCSRCKKDARDKNGEYFVTYDGKKILCRSCVREIESNIKDVQIFGGVE